MCCLVHTDCSTHWLLPQVALQTNAELLQLPKKYEASDSAAILAQVSADLNSPAESTRLEALHWVGAPACPCTILDYKHPDIAPAGVMDTATVCCHVCLIDDHPRC